MTEHTILVTEDEFDRVGSDGLADWQSRVDGWGFGHTVLIRESGTVSRFWAAFQVVHNAAGNGFRLALIARHDARQADERATSPTPSRVAPIPAPWNGTIHQDENGFWTVSSSETKLNGHPSPPKVVGCS